MKEKRNILKVLGVFLLSLFSMVFLWKKEGGEKLLPVLGKVNPGFLFLGLLAYFSYLLMEALAYRYLLGLQGYEMKVGRGIGYSLADSFFSNISPGGSAGQPGQFFYMHRDGISSGVCMMSLTAFNSMYHVAMILFMVLGMATGVLPWVSHLKGMTWILYFGIAAQGIFVLFQLGMMFSRKLLPFLVYKVFDFLKGRRRFQSLVKKEEGVRENLRQYEEFGVCLKENPRVFLQVLFYDAAMLFSLYAVGYFVYRSFGFRELSLLQVIALQSVIHVAVESLPLPGGVGVSEGTLLAIYSHFIPGPFAFAWMVGTRFLTFFTGLFFGGAVVLWMPKLELKVSPSFERPGRGVFGEKTPGREPGNRPLSVRAPGDAPSFY